MLSGEYAADTYLSLHRAHERPRLLCLSKNPRRWPRPHPNHPVAPAPGDFSFRIMRGSCTPNSSTVYSRCSCIRQGRLCQGLLSDSPYSRKPKEQHTIPQKFRYNKYAPFSRFHDWHQLPRYSCNAMSCSYGVPAVAVNAPVFCPVPWRKRE